MEYRELGDSGMLVSEIAYGNWITNDSDVGIACVRAALEAGITTFDTADGYADTKAESALGAALKGERREGLEICTKVYFPTGPGRNDRGLSRKHVMEAIDGSLRRLQTDHVDVYQAHRYDYQTPLEETMVAFADVVHAGKAHYIGVSEWKVSEIRAAVKLARELKIKIVSNQSQYSMLWRVIEAEIQPACEELGITQLVYSPLAQGVLSGKYQRDTPLPLGTRAAAEEAGNGPNPKWLASDVAAPVQKVARGTISGWMIPEVLDRVQKLVPLAADAGMSMPEMAVAWVLSNPNVSAAIVGGSRPEQITQTAKASGRRLDDDLLSLIDEVLDPIVERDPTLLPIYEKRP